jgi:hypothetical protein
MSREMDIRLMMLLAGFTAGLLASSWMVGGIIEAKEAEMLEAVMQVASAPIELLPPPVENIQSAR